MLCAAIALQVGVNVHREAVSHVRVTHGVSRCNMHAMLFTFQLGNTEQKIESFQSLKRSLQEGF